MSADRPPYALFPVVVQHVEQVTPHMKRITVDGRGLPDFSPRLPAQWLKVFVSTADRRSIVGRAYTIRRFDTVSRSLHLDFVLHGDNGPVSAWAARAKVGDSLEVSAVHPRSGFAPSNLSVQRYLLLGDETALPAIAGILEALPARTRADVFIEVADGSEEQTLQSAATVDLTWPASQEQRDKMQPGNLERAAESVGQPGENTAIWAAAESSIVKSIRRHALLAWRVDRKLLRAAGYWKKGKSDHKDEEASIERLCRVGEDDGGDRGTPGRRSGHALCDSDMYCAGGLPTALRNMVTKPLAFRSRGPTRPSVRSRPWRAVANEKSQAGCRRHRPKLMPISRGSRRVRLRSLMPMRPAHSSRVDLSVGSESSISARRRKRRSRGIGRCRSSMGAAASSSNCVADQSAFGAVDRIESRKSRGPFHEFAQQGRHRQRAAGLRQAG